MNWFIDCLTKKYADFSGRARRTEYWMFFLFNVIIGVVLQVVDGAVLGFPALSLVYTLGVLCPGIAVAVRRMHDIGKSGLWLLVGFVPCIGALILIYFLVQDSTPGTNEFGPNPKGG